MKFTCFTILPITILASLCASNPIKLESRAGVKCVAKYSGYLHSTKISALTDTSDESQRGIRIGTDGDDFLTQDNNGPKFQFDLCTAKGWNSPSKQFGQLRLPKAGNQKAITAYIDAYGKGHALKVFDASTATDPLLDRQWWHAQLKKDKKGGSYIIMQLTGNPNDKDHSYDLPFSTYYEEYSEATMQDTGLKFTLFEVKTL